MSHVAENQPTGTPTWIDLAVPDLEQAKAFYGPLFGWEFDTGSGGYTMCLLGGKPVAGIAVTDKADLIARPWTMYFATDDCDATARRITDAGGTVTAEPTDIGDLGRVAVAVDPVGATFGLWQGDTLPGCTVVNEPGSLVRNDLATPNPKSARDFYTKVFDFTLDGNEDLPGMDFTFLRRPDGHEIGGIVGVPAAPVSAWDTSIEVADTDAVAKRAVELGGKATEPEDTPYVRSANITDPFGTETNIGARP